MEPFRVQTQPLSQGVRSGYSINDGKGRVDGHEFSATSIDAALMVAFSAREDISVEFIDVLGTFSTSENIRFYVSIAVTHGARSCRVVESKAQLNRIYEIARKSSEIFDVKIALSQTPGNFVIFDDEQATAGRAADVAGWPFVTAPEIIRACNQALSDRTSFSMLRVNHCEPRVMGFEQIYDKKDIMKTVNIQWGDQEVSDSDVRGIARSIRDAVRCADIVGVPTVKDHITSKNQILEASVFCLAKKLDLFSLDAKFCDVNTHYRMGQSADFFDMLCKATEVVLVTGRNLAPLMAQRLGGRPVRQITIPTESRFNEGVVTKERHFPGVYNKVLPILESTIRPGTVVLVGAGILGKVYCHVAKAAGGVALDVGSLMDAWAGVSSRGSGFDPRLLSQFQANQ